MSGGRWQHWQRAALPYLVGPSILEIGCGPGHLLADLRRTGYIAVGVDRSSQMARLAGRRTAQLGRLVIVADAYVLPFAAQSFHSIVLTFPTPIVADPRLWQEMARVLRPGGRAVIVLGARSNTRIWPDLLEATLAHLAGSRLKTADTDERPAPVVVDSGLTVDGLADVKDLFSMQHLTLTTHHGVVWMIVAEGKDKI